MKKLARLICFYIGKKTNRINYLSDQLKLPLAVFIDKTSMNKRRKSFLQVIHKTYHEACSITAILIMYVPVCEGVCEGVCGSNYEPLEFGYVVMRCSDPWKRKCLSIKTKSLQVIGLD